MRHHKHAAPTPHGSDPQLHFDFPGTSPPPPEYPGESQRPHEPRARLGEGTDHSSTMTHPPASPGPSEVHRELKRAVLRWMLLERRPTGVATDVPTRIAQVKADVAAFRSRPQRNREDDGPSRILVPDCTIVVQCYASREECWPDCDEAERVAPRLVELRARMECVQAGIRRDEPELRDSDSLFEEYAQWDYAHSRNPDYRQLRREIDECEHALYAGTRFERIRQAGVADLLYLAVPAGVVSPDELCDGWGLLWVHQDLSVEVAHDAERRDCLASSRLHLIQNIAAAGVSAEMFVQGLLRRGDGVGFVKRPRGHRRPAPGQLPGTASTP